MAIDNPQNNFSFGLEVQGVIMAEIQKVTFPSAEYTVHKQGSAGNLPDIKTAGKKKVGDLVFDKVVAKGEGDNDIIAWFEAARSGNPFAYKRPMFLVMFDELFNVTERWLMSEAWVSKIEGADLDTREDNSAIFIRTCTVTINDFVPLP